MKSFISLIALIIIFEFNLVESLHSEPRPLPLAPGMKPNEVIKLWGSPEEKEDYEVKRQEIWQYKRGKVIFIEGKLSKWNHEVFEAENAAAIQLTPAAGAIVSPSPDKGTKNPTVVEEILSEIMKEPSQPDSPNLAPPSAANIPSGNIVRPSEIQPPEPIN